MTEQEAIKVLQPILKRLGVLAENDFIELDAYGGGFYINAEEFKAIFILTEPD